jgi:putative addiction module component (TIGR02574 family)
MTPFLSESQINQLNTADKLELITRLWDSLPEVPELPPPDWHQELLDERLERANKSPDSGIPWSEVRDRLRRKP